MPVAGMIIPYRNKSYRLALSAGASANGQCFADLVQYE
jgi:hypothetical protein